MSHNNSEESDFVFSFPAYVYVDELDIKLGTECGELHATVTPYHFRVDGKNAIPIFTDRDQAERFAEETALSDSMIPFELKNPAALAAFLSHAGLESIEIAVVDPTKGYARWTAPRIAMIEEMKGMNEK